MVALTFDDGPWEPYTSQILDVLKTYNVKATFFVIGENLERHPDIVERMWNEGHEIGNHSFTHPNIGAVTEQRARLELNSTERALQSVIGRSTILFRPPYNADAEPTSAEEVWPVVFASKMGYITVGEFIDPQDWNIEGDGTRRRTAQDIAQDIIEKVRTGHGNTILLHDGGGDRSATVAALPILIPELSKEGYTFVKVSGLLHSTTDKMMPKVDKNSNDLLFADKIVFELNYVFKIFLESAFISAIALGTLRAVFITTLALIARRKEKKACNTPGYHPPVSVIIAAYNEGKVIRQTIDSVLANTHAPLEIIVIDDGSKDDTSVEVERCAKEDKRVILIRQENQGKASALNRGIEISKSEILICLDADTSFDKDTIGNLVCKFSDTAVGAVAGNVKVGNRVNILTYWQAIEYITSQNIERRAYGLLNAVTVVPGAVGAWRKQAVLQAGGYLNDTLAEDMDLTWRLRKAGWRIETAIHAFGFTETPDTIHTLFKQRFRWTFGTLQCLWKHRSTLGRYKAFGRVMLPSLWLFQILYQIISPLVDLQILWVLFSVAQSWLSRGLFHQDWQPLSQAVSNFYYIGFMYAFFFVIELTGATIAFSIEREKKGILWWLFWQRLVYRQIMYAVVIKSVQTALSGIRTGWSKAERKGTVGVSPGR
jgi:poly-beta-1,6 N-acetyl-D-glucosamine synthase